MSNGIQQYVKLENCLVLLAWLNSLPGHENNRARFEGIKRADESFGKDRQRELYHLLKAHVCNSGGVS